MPSISDPNTVKALARGYLVSGKVKEQGLLAAEYKPSYARSAKGMKLYEKPAVIAAIAEIEAETCKESNLKIKTRMQRQDFWSTMMDDLGAQRCDRLRASELLGRSEADFTDNINSNVQDEPKPITDEDRAILAAQAKELSKPRLVKETG